MFHHLLFLLSIPAFFSPIVSAFQSIRKYTEERYPQKHPHTWLKLLRTTCIEEWNNVSLAKSVESATVCHFVLAGATWDAHFEQWVKGYSGPFKRLANAVCEDPAIKIGFIIYSGFDDQPLPQLAKDHKGSEIWPITIGSFDIKAFINGTVAASSTYNLRDATKSKWQHMSAWQLKREAHRICGLADPASSSHRISGGELRYR